MCVCYRRGCAGIGQYAGAGAGNFPIHGLAGFFCTSIHEIAGFEPFRYMSSISLLKHNLTAYICQDDLPFLAPRLRATPSPSKAAAQFPPPRRRYGIYLGLVKVRTDIPLRYLLAVKPVSIHLGTLTVRKIELSSGVTKGV
jgi:hypothetical protein